MSDVYGTPHDLYKITLLFKVASRPPSASKASKWQFLTISGHFGGVIISYNFTKFILQVAARNRRRKGWLHDLHQPPRPHRPWLLVLLRCKARLLINSQQPHKINSSSLQKDSDRVSWYKIQSEKLSIWNGKSKCFTRISRIWSICSSCLFSWFLVPLG